MLTKRRTITQVPAVIMPAEEYPEHPPYTATSSFAVTLTPRAQRKGETVDVFELRHRLIADYSDYIQSFINIRDDRIKQHVDNELRDGLLWPEPLLQLNPSFEPGPWIDDMVAGGILHPECKSIFRIKEQGKEAKPLRLHKHQADAVLAAATGDSYVVSTGTGSGKSLAYIVPIVDYRPAQGQRARNPRHRRLSHERLGQQPVERVGEVPGPGLSAEQRLRSPSAAIPDRRKMRSGPRFWRTRPTSC